MGFLAERDRREVRMNDTAQNWVLARANCTLQDSFAAIKQAVDIDVERFNKLAPDKRLDRNFLPERNGSSIVIFRAAPDTGAGGGLVKKDVADVISVQKEAACIWATRESYWSIEICHQWNEETLKCDLMIGGKSYTPSQISQRILTEFFFGV